MANLQKVIKVTQAQYDTLAAGGTVGSYTGLNDNYIYLVKDLLEYVTLTTDQEITGKKTIKDTSLDFLKTGASGNASWQIEEDAYAQLSISRTYNSTKTKMWNFNGRDIIPETTAVAKLGSSSKFIDTIFVNIVNGNSNILFKTGSGNRFLFDNTAITPYVGQTLGTSAYKFGDIYTSGGLRDGNNASYKLVLPNSTSWTANKTIATTDLISSAAFTLLSDTVTITISNSSHTSEWRYTKVYDIAQPDVWSDDHLIGSFSSANGTLEVSTETGLITVCFGGGAMYISSDPTLTGGVSISYGSNDYYRFSITNTGTITFNGNVDWDD